MCLAAVVLGSVGGQAQSQAPFDLVLQGGRVIDPESGFDGIRSIGIRGDRIAEVSTDTLDGREVVDVSGLVVAPGFIDLHAHGQSNEANEFQAHDGVTTALELESGRPHVRSWLQSRTGNALLHFGATVGHGSVRWRAMERYAQEAAAVATAEQEGRIDDETRSDLTVASRASRNESLSSSELVSLGELLRTGLRDGALGIGLLPDYSPGVTRDEVFRVYEFAAEHNVPVFTHVRGGMVGIQEAIAGAAVTGAPLHIVHVNSMALGEIGLALDMVASAQSRGLDITTELYPYTAMSTYLGSAMFDDGWRDRFAISYGELQWVATGERLTAESFAVYREEGGQVIAHMMRPEWIERGVASPVTIIASDGMPYAPGVHPRSAGTFSRVLGRYVREQGALTLSEALAKMTIRPAKRLEGVAPSMRLKGRLQVGADADVTVFDPDTIIDTATFEDDLSFSEGVHHVLVSGTFVVRDGETVEGVYPGRPVIGRYRQ